MVIWLTGCTSGIGKALVPEFINAGHTVIGGGRNSDILSQLSKDHPHHHFLQLDVADESSVQSFCQQASSSCGEPDLLINNAAIINPPRPLWEISAEDFNNLTAININGVANMIRHTVPLMIRAGSGIIVNLSSGWGRSTSPDVAPYCASKWAIEGLSQALAQELPAGLATVALNPGVINTPMLQQTFGAEAHDYPTPEVWAKSAAPFLTAINLSDNGNPLTAPY